MELLKRIDVDDEYLRMESHGEPLVKATNFNAVVDTNLTKDDGNDHVHLPLRCFLDLAQQQTSVEPATKRIKMDTTRSKFIDVDFIMKHVADIVLVLSGLGLIRAGREPTLEERRLQAEAYGHLGFLLQNVNPRELISKVAIENLIEDLGLRKSKGQELKSFAQILEEFQPPAPVSMVHPLQMVMGTATMDRNIQNLQACKSAVTASRNEAHTDSDQLHPGKRVISHPEGQQSSIRQKLEVVDPQARVTQAIHDLLQPRYPGDCPIQPAHSRAFISAVVPCEVCRAIAKETANVLVCDACEKLLHLRCLQSYLMMGIPKGDWYCPHCSDSCKDKQRPPKYGRVKAGFSFKTSRMKGKSSGKGSPTTQKKQPPISADGKSNQQAISKAGMKTSAITQKFEDSAHSSSKSSQSILEHGNSGGGFTALLDSVAQEGQSNLRMAGNCQSSSCIPQPQISTRSAFLQSHSVEPAAVLSTQPQSHRLHSGQGIANAGENNLQFIKPAESCSDTSLLTAASRPFDDKKSNSKEDFEILDEKTNASAELNAEQIYKEVDRFGIEWASDVIHRADGKHFYSACTVGGQLYRLHDCALFRPETPNVPPYIAHLQALWEESGAKWVRVNWFYYPADMIMLPGRPLNPEINEVYESNHGDNNLVGTIQGQCLVLQPDCYAKEMERRQELLKCGNTGEALVPIFLCRWMYDVATATFRPVSGTS